jgi:hypothetical protein
VLLSLLDHLARSRICYTGEILRDQRHIRHCVQSEAELAPHTEKRKLRAHGSGVSSQFLHLMRLKGLNRTGPNQLCRPAMAPSVSSASTRFWLLSMHREFITLSAPHPMRNSDARRDNLRDTSGREPDHPPRCPCKRAPGRRITVIVHTPTRRTSGAIGGIRPNDQRFRSSSGGVHHGSQKYA